MQAKLTAFTPLRMFFVLVVALVFFLPVPVARACSCAETTPADAVAGGSLAFIGAPVSVRDVAQNGEGGVWVEPRRWTFAVETVLKGEATEFVEIGSGFGAGDCGVDFSNAGTVGVVAHGEPGNFSTGSCGGVWSADQLREVAGPGTPPAPQGPAASGPDADPAADPDAAGTGSSGLWILGGLGVAGVALIGVAAMRRREPTEYVDGFSR